MAHPALDGVPSGVVELDASEACLAQGGAVATLVAVLLIPALATVSFAIDPGYISTTSRASQSTSDAAALAGAGQIFASYVAISGAGNRR